MNKRVLLIDPPYRSLYQRTKIAAQSYFPLGLGYIASTLRDRGHTVRLIIHPDESDFASSVINEINVFKPAIIGFSAMTTNFPVAVELARLIKHEADPAIPIMIGGHHVSAYTERILKDHPEIDFVIFGEGELTASELIENIDHRQGFSHINGLVWRAGDKVIKNMPRPLVTDIDKIPMPARELVELDRFSTHSHVAGGRSATMLTSRGCPFGCTFCSAHLVDGKKYRQHSVSYVLNEIEELIFKYDVQYIFMQDDTFTLSRSRVESICEEIINRKLKIAFGCFSRVDVMDEKMARLLKKAGCTSVVFGIESGHNSILKKIKKNISLEKAKDAIRVCNKVGLKSTASFVIGFPFDTLETIQQTIQFGIELNPTLVAFNPLVPFPGSEIFDESLHAPKTVEGWKKYITVGVPPFSFVEGLSPKDIFDIANRGHRRFYLRPTQIWRLLKTIRRPSDLKEYIKSAIGTLFR